MAFGSGIGVVRRWTAALWDLLPFMVSVRMPGFFDLCGTVLAPFLPISLLCRHKWGLYSYGILMWRMDLGPFASDGFCRFLRHGGASAQRTV